MKENSKWFLMFLVTVLSVIIPVVIFGISRENKSLVYEVLGGTIISKADIASNDDLKILYKDENLENLDYQLIKITNDGKAPIKRQDFDKDMTIHYDKATKILSARVIKTKPSNLEVKIKKVDNDVNIEPLLLNKDDVISLQILSTGVKNDPSINARIVGLDQIKDNSPNSTNINMILGIYLLISTITAFVYGATAMLITTRKKVVIPKALMLLVAMSAAIASVSYNNRFSLYKNVDYFSWPLILLGVAMTLGIIYSRLVLIRRAESNYRIDQN